jgi:hypothetical protein
MKIYCLDDFKKQFEKLLSKKSYNNIEIEVIRYFFDKSVEELRSGTRLNQSDDAPYIKKRLSGRGGFRLYFLLLIKNDALYLMFVHPKTGPLGASNITDESKALLYKKVLNCIQTRDYFEVTTNPERNKINFSHIDTTE